MWRNYMTVGVRALVKNKTYAFINIFGLAIGLAACLMLLVYVRYETNYDEWLPNAENTYQLQSHYKAKQTGEETHLQMTSYVAGQRLKADFPQVDRIVYALSSAPVIMRNGNALPTEDVLLVDNLFFDVLQFPLVRRRFAQRALNRPGTVVLTQSEARRVFGRERRARADADDGLARHHHRLSDHRRRPRPAAQQPRPFHHGRAGRHAALQRRSRRNS